MTMPETKPGIGKQIRLLMAPQDERPAVPAPQDAPGAKRAWWKRILGS